VVLKVILLQFVSIKCSCPQNIISLYHYIHPYNISSTHHYCTTLYCKST